jgi:predicted HD phosphohydrolase
MDNEAAFDLLRHSTQRSREGQGVTALQHAWQCASLAEQTGAGDRLQLAAWLRDLGHLMSAQGAATPPGLHDNRHETVAGLWLSGPFGDAVGLPVRLHVQAKRYLVAVHPVYRERLSADSLLSLALQGGAMPQDEALRFRALPWADDALRLRGWDDAGKLVQAPHKCSGGARAAGRIEGPGSRARQRGGCDRGCARSMPTPSSTTAPGKPRAIWPPAQAGRQAAPAVAFQGAGCHDQ